MKYVLAIPALLLATACSGGGGGGSTPTAYPIAGSYYGTVVSGSDNSGNMGITTDAVGNGNFAVQYPGQEAIEETFAPPISSVSGSTLNVSGTIAGSCVFTMTAKMVSANNIKGNYSLACPGVSTVTATFNLPRGTYSLSSKASRMTS
jgi:hypothetical protein